jgi:protoporphyrinogen/coproporphyrinogen III oxidase
VSSQPPSITPPSLSTADVAVIGAGIGGLSTAFALKQRGLQVLVFETQSRTGGVITSHRDGPWLAEGGPNTILDTAPAIPQLLANLGLSERRRNSNPAANARYVVRDGRPVALPGSPPAFFLSPLFSLGAKLNLLAEPFRPRGHADQESVAQFVRRRLGQEFLDYGIDPMVNGIYAGDPSSLSLRHAFPRIHHLEDRYGSLIRGQFLGAKERRQRGEISKADAPKFSFDDGLQVLTDTLAQRLRPHLTLDARIQKLTRLPNHHWSLEGATRGNAFRFTARSIVFAGTAPDLASLQLESPGLPSLTPLEHLPYVPVVSVVLGFPRDRVRHPCQGFGALIPHREGFDILGTLFSSSLFPGRAPDGQVLLTSYAGGARNPEITQLPDGPLIDRVQAALQRLFGAEGTPSFAHLTRWPRAIPQYNLGHDRHQALLDDLERQAPGLYVAGNFRDGVSLSDALLHAGRLADRIHHHLQPTPTAPS